MSEAILARPQGLNSPGVDVSPLLARRVDYFVLVDGPSLTRIPAARPGARLITAATLGSVRLLATMGVG